MQWIKANYQPVQIIGDEPLKNGNFGIEILKTPIGTRKVTQTILQGITASSSNEYTAQRRW